MEVRLHGNSIQNINKQRQKISKYLFTIVKCHLWNGNNLKQFIINIAHQDNNNNPHNNNNNTTRNNNNNNRVHTKPVQKNAISNKKSLY